MMVDANSTGEEQKFETSGDGSFVSVKVAEADVPSLRPRGGGGAARRIRIRLGIEPITSDNESACCPEDEGTEEESRPQGKDRQTAKMNDSWKHLGEASRRIRIKLGKELPVPNHKAVRTEEDLRKQKQEKEEKKARWDTTVNKSVFKCMRCEAKGMTCSMTYFGRIWEDAVSCTRCERNGCKYCVRQIIHHDGRRAAKLHPSIVLDDDEVAGVGALIRKLGDQILGSDNERRALPHWNEDLVGEGVWFLEDDRRTWRDVLPVWQNVSHVGAKRLESTLQAMSDPAQTSEFLRLFARNPSYGRRYMHLKELAESENSSEDSGDQLEEYLSAEERYEDFKNEGWREAALADLENIPDRKSDNEPARRSEPDREGSWFYQTGLERDHTVSWSTGDAEEYITRAESNEQSNDLLTEGYMNQLFWKTPADDSTPDSPRQWQHLSQEVDKILEEEQRQQELRALPEDEKKKRFEAFRAEQKKKHKARMAQIRDQNSDSTPQ